MLKRPEAKAPWQEIGRQIFETIRGERARTREKFANLYIQKPTAESWFKDALVKSAQGDSTLLIKYLRSSHALPSLSRQHREALADRIKYVTGPRSRQPDYRARCALGYATIIYAEWKTALRQAGIPARGHGNDMKDASCGYGIELLRDDVSALSASLPGDTSKLLPERTTVRGLMGRTAKRQMLPIRSRRNTAK